MWSLKTLSRRRANRIMRTGKVLASGLQLLVAIKLLILGALSIAVAVFPSLRATVTYYIGQYPNAMLLVGYFIFALGLLLFLAFYAMNRGQYYQVGFRIPIEVDTKIIQTYTEEYWKKLFPEEDLHVEVVIHKNQTIEVIAEMPGLTFEEQKKMLECTEKELGSLLARHIGYQKELLFTVLAK
jgi:hypothetical protein